MSKETANGGQDAPMDEGARSFGVFIAKFADGTLNAELSETLRDAVKALEVHAEDFGKAKGSITLVLSLAADRESGIVAIVPDVKTKLPRSARKHGIYWVKGSGELVPENPRQQKLPLAAVPSREVRAAPAPER